VNRDEMILKLHSLYAGADGGWYLSWLQSQSDIQLEIYYKRAFKNEN